MERLNVNYHTHTYRCNHASGKDEDYVIKAINAGIKVLGFSDHTPRIFKSGHISGFRMRAELAKDYFDSIRMLREKYKDEIDVKAGVEAEYYENDPGYFDYIDEFQPDYIIQGQHFIISEESGRRAARPTRDEKDLADYYLCLYKGIDSKRFFYIAHPDMINFTGDDRIFIKHTEEFLRYAKEHKTLLEINRLGLFENRHYPRELFWELCGRTGCKAVIGLDAHNPAVFDDTRTMTKCIEYAKKHNVILAGEDELIIP